MLILLALALVIAVLACVFALQNSHAVEIVFLSFKWEASMALVLLATFSVGALVAFLASLPTLIKNKLEVADLKKKLPPASASAIAKEPTKAAAPPKTPPPSKGPIS
jgi:uncharacterized integral membrane protein